MEGSGGKGGDGGSGEGQNINKGGQENKFTLNKGNAGEGDQTAGGNKKNSCC